MRDAYDAAMAKTRTKKHLLVAGSGGAFVPERVEWLHSEMLKTRVAHGYCSRHPAAGACPYANVSEQCDNFATAPEFLPALLDQLADVRVLRDDAAARGWDSEAARHHRVVDSIEGHVAGFARQHAEKTSLDSSPEGRLLAYGFRSRANYVARVLLVCSGHPPALSPG